MLVFRRVRDFPLVFVDVACAATLAASSATRWVGTPGIFFPSKESSAQKTYEYKKTQEIQIFQIFFHPLHQVFGNLQSMGIQWERSDRQTSWKNLSEIKLFHKKPLPHPTSPQKDTSRQKKETQLTRRTKGMKKRTLIWVHLQIIPSFNTFVAASSDCNTAVNIPFVTARICFIPLLDPIAPKILNLKVFNIQKNVFVVCFLFPLLTRQFPISTKKSGCLHLPEFHHTCGRQTPTQGRSSRMGGQGSSITTHEAWFQPGERRFVPHGWECLDDVNNLEGICFFVLPFEKKQSKSKIIVVVLEEVFPPFFRSQGFSSVPQGSSPQLDTRL